MPFEPSRHCKKAFFVITQKASNIIASIKALRVSLYMLKHRHLIGIYLTDIYQSYESI